MVIVDLQCLSFYTISRSSKPGDRCGKLPQRKVRAPPGRMLGNAQEGGPYGKCHRNIPPVLITLAAGKGEMVR